MAQFGVQTWGLGVEEKRRKRETQLLRIEGRALNLFSDSHHGVCDLANNFHRVPKPQKPPH